MTLKLRLLLVYAISLVLAVALFFTIRAVGPGQILIPEASHSAPGPSPTLPGQAEVFARILLVIIAVVVSARIVGALFRKLSQPPVMGEVVAGILLGPSFLGLVAPGVSAYVIPAAILPHLSVIAQVGIVLYMFLVGLELDTSLIRQRTQASIVISHVSIVVPFLLGSALAIWLYPRFSSSSVPFTSFALFLGAAMSITAFPVLARILTDRAMEGTPLGTLALACAAIDDVTAWCLLALVVGIVRSQPSAVFLTVTLSIVFVLFVLFVVKPGALWLVRRRAAYGATTRDMFAIACIALLLAAWGTERIGIHALFGAFLVGSITPHDSDLARDFRRKCEDLVLVLLLPVFFAFTGMRTQVALLHEPSQWLWCIVIIAVASLGKFGGTFLGARATGSDSRQAASLGVLLNTRGLMELIVLNVGLDLGILSPTLFTMFVLMALATTLATTPILQALSRHGSPATTT